MPRGPVAFRQRDVRAAIKAVEALGKAVGAVEIRPDGTIRVIVSAGGEQTGPNPWDVAVKRRR